jgi:two-component system response regulator YesN
MQLPSAQHGLSAIGEWLVLVDKAHYRAANLAKLCHVSSRTLRRFFHERLQESLRSWLMRLRTQKAEELILAGERIKEVAQRLGFHQIPQFSRWFKTTHGLSPRAWRKLSMHSAPLEDASPLNGEKGWG